MLADLLIADAHRILFFCTALLCTQVILLRCHTDDRLQRLHNPVVCHFTDPADHRTVFDTACRLHDHVIPGLDLIAFRIKVIDLPGVSESHSYNFNHVCSPL